VAWKYSYFGGPSRTSGNIQPLENLKNPAKSLLLPLRLSWFLLFVVEYFQYYPLCREQVGQSVFEQSTGSLRHPS
jgi:hypothetical protein